MLVEACGQRRINVIVLLLCLEEAGGSNSIAGLEEVVCISAESSLQWSSLLGLLLQIFLEACGSALISPSVVRAFAVRGCEPEALKPAKIPGAPTF